jgi:hypothetical protein
VAILFAAIPYVKNLILFHNPIWPVRMPLWGDRFPYTFDTRPLRATQSPPPLLHLSGFQLFFYSVLEIRHPTEYTWRERWLIDQGNGWIDYRTGGFWKVAVVTGVLAAVQLGFLFQVRKGWMLLGALAAMWVLTALVQESYDLRYVLFLPLTMAAVIAMLLPHVRQSYPAVTLVLMALILGEFARMTYVNRAYYKLERVNYQTAAEIWNMKRWWAVLQRGHTYCAVGFEPSGFMLTGPTMKEFFIIDQPDRRQCPANTEIIIAPSVGNIQ